MGQHQQVRSSGKTCSSRVTQTINGPIHLVWSVLSRFDQPQVYKKLVQTCSLIHGSGEVGSVRCLTLRSGLPGSWSVERLERMDENEHVMIYKVINGDDKLVNFQVTCTLHEIVLDNNNNNEKRTVVTKSYTVDVPQDSNEEDTCYVADTIMQLNLRTLAIVVQKMARGIWKE